MIQQCDDEGKSYGFWRELVLIATPILVAEACLAAREWLKRRHKAKLKARVIVACVEDSAEENKE